MKRDLAHTATADRPAGTERPATRAAGPADAEGIIGLRSEFVLSEPLDTEWSALCSTQLARRLSPGGDARAQVALAPDGSVVSCALGLIHPVLSPRPPTPRGWPRACTRSPHGRSSGAAASPGRCCPPSSTVSRRTGSPSSNCTRARRPHRCTGTWVSRPIPR